LGGKVALLLELQKMNSALPPGKGGGGLAKASSVGHVNAVSTFIIRENGGKILIPVSNDIASIDIEWSRDYEVVDIALVQIIADDIKPSYYRLISAVHSKHGDVLDLISNVDRQYATLDSGEHITFKFDGSGELESQEKAFLFEVSGRYYSPQMANGIDAIEKLRTSRVHLGQNYPNPFNPITEIAYTLTESGFVTLRVYNTLGQEVRTLVNGIQNAGRRAVLWDGKNNDGVRVSSGIYVYRLQTRGAILTKRMILLK
jgi:hypothetical protein